MLAMYFVALSLIFERFSNLGGWSLGEVAFLWGLVEFSFGLMDMIFSGFDPSNFGQSVRMGTFDQLLLRPINVTMQVLGKEFILRRVGRMVNGIGIFLIAIRLAQIDWTLGKLLYLPWVVVGLVCFFGGLFVIGASFTFWTVDSVEAMNILTYGGSEMMSYPMQYLPRWLRQTFTYVVPAIFQLLPGLTYSTNPILCLASLHALSLALRRHRHFAAHSHSASASNTIKHGDVRQLVCCRGASECQTSTLQLCNPATLLPATLYTMIKSKSFKNISMSTNTRGLWGALRLVSSERRLCAPG